MFSDLDLLKVNMDLDWSDITNEYSRTYLFPNKLDNPFERPLVAVTIEQPVMLNVNYKSGGHRIIDNFGKGWYIPAGWVALHWEGWEEGMPVYGF